MSRGNILRFFLLPTLVGLVATTAVYLYLGPTANEAVELGEMVDVVLARTNIPAKTVISAEMLTVQSMPARYVHRNAVRDPEEAVGRVTLVPLAEGEMVLANKLAGEENKPGLAYHVPPGMRAVSIPVDAVRGVGGFVQPGDRVDVVVSFQRSDETGNRNTGESVLVLQNLLVLAVGSRIEAQPTDAGARPEEYAYVTLAVTPQEAVRLTMVDEFGRIRLALRPAVDDGSTTQWFRDSMEAIGR